MPRLIKTWDELDGLESENYKIVLDEPYKCSGWIVPKDESIVTEKNYYPTAGINDFELAFVSIVREG